MPVDDYRASSLKGWSAVAPDWVDLIDRIDLQLGAAADWIIAALALRPGQRVLELAGGPGTLSLMAARAVGTDGHVTYSDFAEPMVAAARERLRAEGEPAVECLVIDAEAIDLPDGSVDAVACRMGFMLMADPEAALRETARVLAPGGRVGLAVWGAAEDNPWAVVPMRAVASELKAPPPPSDAPGMWSLADPGRLRSALERAGLTDVRIEELDESTEFDSPEHFVEVTARLAGPLRALLASVDATQQEQIKARIRDATAPYQGDDGRVIFPQRMLVASARR